MEYTYFYKIGNKEIIILEEYELKSYKNLDGFLITEEKLSKTDKIINNSQEYRIIIEEEYKGRFYPFENEKEKIPSHDVLVNFLGEGWKSKEKTRRNWRNIQDKNSIRSMRSLNIEEQLKYLEKEEQYVFEELEYDSDYDHPLTQDVKNLIIYLEI